MHCPKCPGTLKEVVVEGIVVDVCWLCQGIWFDKKELETVLARDMRNFRLGDLDSLHIQEPDVVRLKTHINQKIGPCPRCKNVPLKQEPCYLNEKLEINICPKCLGTWFDGEEVHLLREQTLANVVKKWDDFRAWLVDIYESSQPFGRDR